MTAEEALNLGIMYYNGEIVKPNSRKAFELFKQAEALGSQEVYRWLGLYYWEEETFFDNSKIALAYLEKALEFNPNDTEILWLVGKCYEKGWGVQRDKKKYFELILKGSELGHKQSSDALLYCCLHGIGTEKDLTKALSFAEKKGDKWWIKKIKEEMR